MERIMVRLSTSCEGSTIFPDDDNTVFTYFLSAHNVRNPSCSPAFGLAHQLNIHKMELNNSSKYMDNFKPKQCDRHIQTN